MVIADALIDGEVGAGMPLYSSRDEALEVIDRTFGAVERDPDLGPQLQAAGLRERLWIDDLELNVGLEAGRGDRCLEWSFDDRLLFEPRISLFLDSPVANSILQGAQSIGVAIARRQIRVEGEAAAALVHLPATRLICRRYAELIERDYPHLVIR